MSFLDPITAAGPATALETTGAPVDVEHAAPPNPGDVLTAVDATHATWQPGGGGGGGGDGGNAGGLETTGAPVDVSSSAPPNPGDVLVATDATHATWQPPSGGGGGDVIATALATSTGPSVDVVNASPEAGQVLMATSATEAFWRVPGLRYDPAVRFNVNDGGVATIEPGTWGFVYTAPVDAVSIEIFVVSSLTAPPVDSRFGLYVSPSQGLNVAVSLIGASQIMAIDGTLDTSVSLLPGGMYEWVFYHEDGAAIWGLVSYTANLTLPTLANTVDSASGLHVDFVLITNRVLNGNSGIYDGVTVANDYYVLLVAQTDPTENGFWLTHDGPWERPDGYPLPVDTDVGQGAYIRNGDTQTGALWAHLGHNVWKQITGGDGIVGGIGLTRDGNALSVVYGTTFDTAAQGNDSRLSDDRVASGLRDTTGVVSVSAAAAPSAGAVLTATDATHATWQSPSFDAFPAWKMPCRLCNASGDHSLSGLANVDGFAPAAGDRVLVVAQTTQSQNGIYLAASGAWSRASDANVSAKITSGMQVAVTSGLTYFDTVWTLTSPEGNPSLNVSALVFTQTDFRGYQPASNPLAVTPSISGSTGNTKKYADQNHVHPFPAPNPSLNGFRLTTQSGSSIPADGSFSTIYAVAHKGTKIALYSGTSWYIVDGGASISVAVTGQTAGVPSDVFAVYGAALNTWSLELTPWTNTTTRATALTLVDGVYVKSGSTTKRYLGTILPDTATTFVMRSGATGTNKGVCGLWNQDNRIRTRYAWQPTFDTWSPSSGGVWEPYGGGSGPHIELVTGQSIDDISAEAIGSVNPGSADATLGIGIDSTTGPTGHRQMASNTTAVIVGLTARVGQKPSIGRKTVNMLGHGTSTAPVFYGAHGAMQAGLSLDVWH